MRKCKLVLGNGFDLFCGLNTKFNDYNSVYNDLYCNKLDDLIDEFLKNYITSGTDSTFASDLEDIKDNIRLWDYILFKFGPNDYWYNFEEILHDFITKNLNSVKEYYNLVSKFVLKRRSYLDRYDEDNNRLLYIATAFGLFRGFNSICSSDVFLKELILFEDKFGNYINNQFDGHMESMIKLSRPFFAELLNNYTVTSIDTFNYTPIETSNHFARISNCIYHINGSTETHPIFGYDYSENDEYSVKFSKTFRRIRSSYYCEEYNCKYPLADEFDDIVIFGHSLCKMDYSYYFPIFNYMHILESNYKNRIIIYYYNDDGQDRRTELLFSLNKMLNEYSLEIEGKVNNRLLDSLSTQGRLLFIPVPIK